MAVPNSLREKIARRDRPVTRKPFLQLALAVALLVALASHTTAAQQQNLPDAPSPQKSAPPEQNQKTLPPPTANPEPPPPQAPPDTPPPADSAGPPPSSAVKTVPPGGATKDPESARDQMFTLVRNVNFVVVPVTVRDTSGKLTEGLLRNDFSIFEDGVQQDIRFFTSDPFPLSAAVVVDLGMSDQVVKKIDESVAALAGAFSQFDEVAFYTFHNTVAKLSDFAAVNQKMTAVLQKLKQEKGEPDGPPINGGPMVSGPSVNGRPWDASQQQQSVKMVRTESRVLNDAVLQAALDLAKRERSRRKVLFIISDGKEHGSRTSYRDVLKVLLSNEITVYAVAVGSSAIPGYEQVDRARVPIFGAGNILPKYASATGGDVFSEFTARNIENAYARVTEEARNQYTIGYTTRATAANNYREIEVRVHRPGLKVQAKYGYYPLPTVR